MPREVLQCLQWAWKTSDIFFITLCHAVLCFWGRGLFGLNYLIFLPTFPFPHVANDTASPTQCEHKLDKLFQLDGLQILL